MSKRFLVPVVFFGIISAILVMVFMSARSSSLAAGESQEAAPEAEKSSQIGRFQISAWGGGHIVDGRMKVAGGVYIIDTQTGELYSSTNESPPKLIGSVSKKK